MFNQKLNYLMIFSKLKYKFLRFIKNFSNDKSITESMVKDATFRLFIYLQLFHTIILIGIGFLYSELSNIFYGAAIYSMIVNGIALLLKRNSQKVYLFYITLNIAVLLISNAVFGAGSSLLGLAISIYTYTVLTLLLLGPRPMFVVMGICLIFLIFNTVKEYFLSSNVSVTDVQMQFEMNLRQLFIYGHLLFYLLITLFIYFYLNKLRLRRIKKLLSNRNTLLRYLTKLNEKLSSYAFYHSHELRAPVSRALGINELILKTYEIDDPEVKRLMLSLNESVNEIDGIIRKMNNELEELQDKKQYGNNYL